MRIGIKITKRSILNANSLLSTKEILHNQKKDSYKSDNFEIYLFKRNDIISANKLAGKLPPDILLVKL